MYFVIHNQMFVKDILIPTDVHSRDSQGSLKIVLSLYLIFLLTLVCMVLYFEKQSHPTIATIGNNRMYIKRYIYIIYVITKPYMMHFILYPSSTSPQSCLFRNWEETNECSPVSVCWCLLWFCDVIFCVYGHVFVATSAPVVKTSLREKLDGAFFDWQKSRIRLTGWSDQVCGSEWGSESSALMLGKLNFGPYVNKTKKKRKKPQAAHFKSNIVLQHIWYR